MEMDKRSITTIAINWKGLCLKHRLRYFIWLCMAPYKMRKELGKEYAEWSALGVFQNRWQRIAYLLDHFVLWGIYCLIALICGSARGFSWSTPNRGCEIYGIDIKPRWE